MKSIVIVISGGGSNMRAIVRTCEAERWPARIVAVVADRSDAAGLQWAREQGLATALVEYAAFDSRDAFDDALAHAIDGFAPDWVANAGFMRILGAKFVRQFDGRLLNIHPSLLPAFPGLGTHRRAIEAGVKCSGATVHFVTPQLDAGPIVIQAVVPVLPDDTRETLAARVLEREHVTYPLALRWAVNERLRIVNGRVEQLDGEPQLLV